MERDMDVSALKVVSNTSHMGIEAPAGLKRMNLIGVCSSHDA